MSIVLSVDNLYAGKNLSLILTNLDASNVHEFIIGSTLYKSSVDSNRSITVTTVPQITVDGAEGIDTYQRMREELKSFPLRLYKLRVEQVSNLASSTIGVIRTTLKGLQQEDLDILDISPYQFQNDVLEIPFNINLGLFDAITLKVKSNSSVGLKFFIERIAKASDFSGIFAPGQFFGGNNNSGGNNSGPGNIPIIQLGGPIENVNVPLPNPSDTPIL